MEIMELPSFFKVMPHDFKSLLRIPPLWVKTFEHMLPGHALLQTKSGETWHVKIEIVDGRHCFTDGWSKFVKDRQLKMNDFLVFWLIRAKKSIFRVATYGVTGCEKDMNSAASTSHVPFNSERSNTTYGPRPRGRKSKKIKQSGRSGDVGYFELVLLKRHRSRLFVPAKFARETGLIHKKEVMVQYPNGWPITAPLTLYKKCGTLHLCGKPGVGWPEFWKKNRLLERRKYGFKFVPETESILVQLVKEQR